MRKGKGAGIHQILYKGTKKEIRKKRLYMGTIVDEVLYLAQQNNTFRGDHESFESTNRGGFKKVVYSADCKTLYTLYNYI